MSTYKEGYGKVYNQTIHLLKISISLSESFVNGIYLASIDITKLFLFDDLKKINFFDEQ